MCGCGGFDDYQKEVQHHIGWINRVAIPERESDADVLYAMGMEVVKCQKCPCSACSGNLNDLIERFGSRVNVAANFVDSLNYLIRFKALFEGWTYEQIESAMKVEQKQAA